MAADEPLRWRTHPETNVLHLVAGEADQPDCRQHPVWLKWWGRVPAGMWLPLDCGAAICGDCFRAGVKIALASF